jgi:hypothetical protein
MSHFSTRLARLALVPCLFAGCSSTVSGGTQGTGGGAAGRDAGNGGSTPNQGGSAGRGGASGSPNAGGGPGRWSYAQVVLADQPIGYWRLGDVPPITLVADELGANPGTAQGGTQFGQTGALSTDADTAVGFDGQTGCVEIGNAVVFRFGASSSFTLEAWISPDTLIGTVRHIVAKSGNDGAAAAGMGYALDILDTQAQLRLLSGDGTGDSFRSAGTIQTDVFTHVVATLDGATSIAAIYLNGTPAGSRVVTTEPGVTSSPLAIGCRFQGTTPTDFFDGLVDEVAVYDKVLSPERVQAHYDAR